MVSSLRAVCDDSSLKIARKLLKQEVLYLHFGEDADDYEVLSCTHKQIDNRKATFEVQVRLKNKFCDFTFSVATMGDTVMIKNQADVRQQNKLCQSKEETAEDIITESVENVVENPIVTYSEEVKKVEEHLLGGVEPCTENQKAEYLSTLLTTLGKPQLFGPQQVIKCTSQVVYGWNVALTFGNNAETACEAFMYITPDGSKPEITLNKDKCFEIQNENLRVGKTETDAHMLGGWKDCRPDLVEDYMYDVNRLMTDGKIEFNANQVFSCKTQIVAGIKVEIVFGFSEKRTCKVQLYFPPATPIPQLSVNSDACLVPHEEEKIIIDEKPMLAGGWSDCSESQKEKYIEAALASVGKAGLFVARDVVSCQKQVVAGLKVKLTFGSDTSKVCYADLFYALGQDTPKVDLTNDSCLEAEVQTYVMQEPLEIRREEHLMGGHNPCSSSQKEEYLALLLKTLDKPQLFGVDQVTKCTTQVVNGFNVNLSFGNDEEHECSAHMYIKIGQEKPEITMKSDKCFASENDRLQVPQLLLNIFGGWKDCDETHKAQYLSEAQKLLHIENAFSEKNVLSCKTQVVAGINAKISFGYEEKTACEVKLFYGIGQTTPQITVIRGDCFTPESSERLDGGYQKCSEQNKNEFLNSLLTKLNHKGLFTANQVSLCEEQIVAGTNVKLQFGNSDGKTCKAELFFPLYTSEPEIKSMIKDCLPSEPSNKNLIGLIESEFHVLGGQSDCAEEDLSQFLSDALALLHKENLFTAKNVLSCKSQIVAGQNVFLTFGTETSNACVVHLFYPLGQAQPTIEVRSDKCLEESKLAQREEEKLKHEEFTIVEQKKLQHNVGTFLSCNVNDVASYTSDALAHLKAEHLYSTADVIDCSSKVVSGIIVRLTIGLSRVNSCELELYYGPGALSPDVDVLSDACISQEALEQVEEQQSKQDEIRKKYHIGEQMTGAFTNSCDESLKAKYLSAVLGHLNRVGLFSTSEVTSCHTQVVNGINVKLSFGSDEQHLCEAKLYYSTNPDILPTVAMINEACLPAQPLIGQPNQFEPCKPEIVERAIESFRAKYTESSKYHAVYKQNVVSCSQRFADGIEIKMKLNFNKEECEYELFVAPSTNAIENQKFNCFD